jgi:hypothetical protein
MCWLPRKPNGEPKLKHPQKYRHRAHRQTTQHRTRGQSVINNTPPHGDRELLFIALHVMLSEAHGCPLSEVQFASQTITSVLDDTPFVSYLYSDTRPPRIPLGRAGRLSVYLYRNLTTGLVLTVDDEEKKGVGVAVWQSPSSKTGMLSRLREWCVQGGFDVWDHLHTLYYGGGGLNVKVISTGGECSL